MAKTAKAMPSRGQVGDHAGRRRQQQAPAHGDPLRRVLGNADEHSQQDHGHEPKIGRSVDGHPQVDAQAGQHCRHRQPEQPPEQHAHTAQAGHGATMEALGLVSSIGLRMPAEPPSHVEHGHPGNQETQKGK
jgi:hypothetical protein